MTNEYYNELTPIEQFKVKAEVALIENKKAIEMFKYIQNQLLIPAIEDNQQSFSNFETINKDHTKKIKKIQKIQKDFSKISKTKILPPSDIQQNIVNNYLNIIKQKKQIDYNQFHKNIQDAVNYDYQLLNQKAVKDLNQYHSSQTKLKKSILKAYSQIVQDLA